MIPWLESSDAFPPLELALGEPNGLLCAGGDLSPQRILQAYLCGIFPWYAKDEPILWWSPDPRMVLVPAEFKISRSLRKTLHKGNYLVRLDYNFPAIIRACAHLLLRRHRWRNSGNAGLNGDFRRFSLRPRLLRLQSP